MILRLKKYISYKLFNLFSYAANIQNKNKIDDIRKQLKEGGGNNISIEFPFFITGNSYISIGESFKARANFRIEAIDEFNGKKYEPMIIIGNKVTIENNCHIGAINKIVIGDNVLIASNVYISDHFHGEISTEELSVPPMDRILSSKGPVIIEKNVWIGDSVCILSGVTIGEGSIIGANSVVTKSVPKNAVVAGSPAKIIKQL